MKVDGIVMITDNDSSHASHVLRRLAPRGGQDGEDAGFTLIELMVVLLILAILLAIAIPTFLGVTKSANDRATQSNLNTALVNAKAAFQSQGQSYLSSTVSTPALLATALHSAEPSLTFTTGSIPGSTNTVGTISVYVDSNGYGVILAGQAKGTNNCWYIMDNSQAEAASAAPYLGMTAGGVTGSSSVSIPAGTYYGKTTGAAAGSCNPAAPATAAATIPTVWQGNGFSS
jgi:type IV pilus assembly protein PilA